MARHQTATITRRTATASANGRWNKRLTPTSKRVGLADTALIPVSTQSTTTAPTGLLKDQSPGIPEFLSSTATVRDVVVQVTLIRGGITNMTVPVAIGAGYEGLPLAGGTKAFDRLLDCWLSRALELGIIGLSLGRVFPINLQKLHHPAPAPSGQPAGGGPRDLKQVWFAGVHCDIGGGYPEAESGLSKIALEWMLAEAYSKGLLLDKARTDLVLGRRGDNYQPPDANAKMHDSLTVAWCPAEFVPKKHYDYRTDKTTRRMNLFRNRTIPPGAMVHESIDRRSNYAPRVPPGTLRVATLPLP